MANLYRNSTFIGLADWLKASADSSIPRIASDQSDDWKEPNVSAVNGEAVIALNWGPFHTVLYQTVPALIIGATYKITWNVKRDMQHPDTNPQVAGDPLSAEARIKAGQAAGPWHDGATLKHNEQVNISATFVARSVSENLGIEVRARHSLWRNHFTLSSPVLELVSSPQTPPSDGGALTDLQQLEAAYNSATSDLLYAQTILQAAMVKLGAVNLYIQRMKPQ